MLVEWDPENGEDKQSWMFDPDDVFRKEALGIEKHYGGSYDQFQAALLIGEMNARGVLLWHMLCQVHPKLRFEDVPNFRVRQLKVRQGVRELKRLAERVQKMRLEPETREQFEMQLEVDMREAMEREGIEGDVSIVDGQLAIEARDGTGVEVDLPKQA